MSLFPQDPCQNLLPSDGIVLYHGPIIPQTTADQFYQGLLSEVDWQNDQAKVFGKTITTKRKVAWYADKPFPYTYSNTTKTALPWLPVLLDIKAIVQAASRETFNSCLLNLYHDGNEGMAWHSDAEKELKAEAAIASVSFNAERKFAFKHKTTKETLSLVLEHGSLLVMKGKTQVHWLHRLPPTKAIHPPRINLTFRTIND